MNKIIPYKSRKIDYSKPVYVYRNLNVSLKEKVYSIKQDGLVKGHSTELTLRDCKFFVNKKGQGRVRKEKRKNVHSYIIGYIDKHPNNLYFYPYSIKYNPYLNDFFVAFYNGCYQYAFKAETIKINEDGVFGAGVN